MKRLFGFSYGFFFSMCYIQGMSYRTIKIDWLPQSGKHWTTFTTARLEAGRLWSWLVERHADARQQGDKWPSKADLQQECKRQFAALHSQSVQQIMPISVKRLHRLNRCASMEKYTNTPTKNRVIGK